ncbi:hypothetical protein E1B28_000130 [Marasmius oreades]|uniref:Uncharacterized protein n=1 Tax=Marasmius oreades TaxID=181124 RepID=A0A9P7V0S8_9AGAR|nr:uncharacterized protein E1B28_000130 [Marasmius oreades]KAG7098161.1 hypothetical protein E1B28_000130 [Marasmius oreades]
MTDSNSSTMEVFTGASNVNIGNGNFTSIGRDQINYYTTQTTIVQTRDKKRKIGSSPPELSKKRRGKKRKICSGLLELSEFTEIKRGDIYKDKDICYFWQLCSNGKDNTEAAVYHADINITGPFGQKKFTVKEYRGRNAKKVGVEGLSATR